MQESFSSLSEYRVTFRFSSRRHDTERLPSPLLAFSKLHLYARSGLSIMYNASLTPITERSSSQRMRQPVSITPMPSNISIPVDYGITIPARGRSNSPIRLAPSIERLRRAPSRTFVPPAFPIDIIDFPECLHPRIRLGIRVSAPVFMGGATAEGAIHIIVDGGTESSRAKRKLSPLSIDRLSVSLVGIERSGARQYMFRCLTTDLIDEAHPPPIEMAFPNQPMSDRLWEIMPSKTILPFRLDLPVKLGPPPYTSKRNSITYLISVLVEAKIDGMRAYVRESEAVTVLTVHDRRFGGLWAISRWCFPDSSGS